MNRILVATLTVVSLWMSSGFVMGKMDKIGMVGGPCTATPCRIMYPGDQQKIDECQKERDEACARWHEKYG